MVKVSYALAIGSLMYAMVVTRLNITYAVGVVSIFMSNPGKQHSKVVKWILRYLHDTTKKCLYFKKGELKLQGYVDVDFASETDCGRSIIRYMFTLSTITINWISQL